MHRSLSLFAALVTITSCARPLPQSDPAPTGQAALFPMTPSALNHVQHLIDSLPLRDKIAQLIMPWLLGGYESLDATEMAQALQWVNSDHVGGIIISIGSQRS